MTLEYVEILFQIIAFLFAISVHESAHAWMGNLRGDPTARMLGRITLNPIKHIDPVGSVLLLLINVLLGVFNLIPVPPLDGSHVLRHFLPEPLRRAYDMLGVFGLLILVYFGGGILARVLDPVLGLFESLL